MKKLLAVLVSGLFFQASAQAEQCAVDRYQISGTQLQADDRLELTVAGETTGITLKAGNSAANKWPAVLGRRINSVFNADLASSGTQAKLDSLGRYIPQNSVNANFIDVMQADANVSLTLNGADFSSALVPEATSGVSSGSAIIPGWSKTFISSDLFNFIRLSNVTNQDVTVNVTLYAQDGTEYNEASEAGTQINHTGTNVISTAGLFDGTGVTIGANQTVSVALKGGVQKFGYGRIVWTADGCLDHALTGIMIRHATAGPSGDRHAAQTQYELNGGKPF